MLKSGKGPARSRRWRKLRPLLAGWLACSPVAWMWLGEHSLVAAAAGAALLAPLFLWRSAGQLLVAVLALVGAASLVYFWAVPEARPSVDALLPLWPQGQAVLAGWGVQPWMAGGALATAGALWWAWGQLQRQRWGRSALTAAAGLALAWAGVSLPPGGRSQMLSCRLLQQAVGASVGADWAAVVPQLVPGCQEWPAAAAASAMARPQ